MEHECGCDIAESQAFTNGNKRTAISSTLVFLGTTGAYVRLHTWQLYLAMNDIANKKLSKSGLAELFRKVARRNE